ncbi:hypothetical protein [Halodesulfurarchaeum formicicum]|nr:hypothetical protein [Halodesulfurarchaeum formicicum]
MAEKPDKDADADEIARWMEEDFWKSVSEGAQKAIQDKKDNSEE